MLQRTMTDSFMRSQVLMLLFCWGSVSSQSVVKGVVGGNVLLPCIYNKTLQEVNVFWREKNSSDVVMDIIKGKETVDSPTYKGRVSSFPQEYNRGNFSIILKKLQQNDSNTYECDIADVDIQWFIKLVVSDEPEERKSPNSSPGAAGTNVLHVVLLIVLTLLLCF